jgi:predicted O-methyltransferase YrrM
MELMLEQVSRYADQYTQIGDALLSLIESETLLGHPEAHMLSGHVQGQLLRQISLMIRPERILEIGSFVGYSALCLAAGLTTSGVLHTIEHRKEDAERARTYFRRSSLNSKIVLHEGDALDVMEALKEEWDLVFIDADKINYIRYYEAVLPKLRVGGWILADNVLFHGQVLEEPVRGKNARAIAAFNEHVRQDSRTEQVLLTVRDGLMLIRKT